MNGWAVKDPWIFFGVAGAVVAYVLLSLAILCFALPSHRRACRSVPEDARTEKRNGTLT